MRDDLHRWHKDLAQWLRDDRKRTGCKIAYLLVPELHADDTNWHIHGLVMGMDDAQLRPWTADTAPTQRIRDMIADGRQLYDWPRYRDRYGWCTVERLYSREMAGRYMAKYVTKTMAATAMQAGAHLYYCSKGLRRPERVIVGRVAEWLPEDGRNECCNDHCIKRWFEGPDALADAVSWIRPDDTWD